MRRLLLAVLPVVLLTALAGPANAGDEVQEVKVEGVGTPGPYGSGGCGDSAGAGSDYVIAMAGDLEGCIYGWVLEFEFNEETGEYQELGRELFVGSYGDRSGTFVLTEQFYAVFAADGSQLSGGCSHPIHEGSGTGDFANARGKLTFVDDVNLGVANYQGELKLM